VQHSELIDGVVITRIPRYYRRSRSNCAPAKIIEPAETCPINNQSTINITTHTNTSISFNSTQSIVMFFTLSSVLASLKKFREEESECPICLEPCTDTLVSPECSHRFCGKCIKESLHKCNHECPTCRVHIPTYRTCRRDPQFDRIVSTRTETK
jgi:hypothetical protein